MSSVGAYLRGLRERQGMSVDELSRATRVLSHYLEALEADDLRTLPAPVFAKGFIRAYCQAVGVAPDEALKLYDRSGIPAPDLTKVPVNAVRIAAAPEAQPRPLLEERDYLAVTPPVPPQSEQGGSRARGTVLISFVLLVVLGAAFFAVTHTLQSGRDGDGERTAQVGAPQAPAATEAPAASPATAQTVVESAPSPPPATHLVKTSPSVPPSAPAPSAPAASMATPGASPATSVALPARSSSAPSAAAVAPAAPAAAAPAAPAGAAASSIRGLASPYRLVARTTEVTWMRVRTEDGRTSEETIPANEVREWISNGPFIITIGNAGGVSLELNGRPVPPLGASGAVITRLVLPAENQ